MDSLRRPLFFVALALLVLVVLVELGATGVLGKAGTSAAQVGALTLPSDVREAFNDMDSDQRAELETLGGGDKPPGLGILYMAFLDGVLLFTVGLIGVSLLVPERVQGRIQGCATFIFGFLLILAAILAIFAALGLLTLMLSLLLSVPFGTLAYLALFGFFDRGGANVALSLLMLLKLGFAGTLVFAHQRFLQNKALILLVLCSLLANIIISFLHNLVPGFLVSITDAIAALIVAILAVIWLVLLLFGSLFSIVKAIRPTV